MSALIASLRRQIWHQLEAFTWYTTYIGARYRQNLGRFPLVFCVTNDKSVVHHLN